MVKRANTLWGPTPTCPECGSTNVFEWANLTWEKEAGTFTIEDIITKGCEDCDARDIDQFHWQDL